MSHQPSTATLLLRLAGPMQSWGTQSRFSVRDTGLEPSKSGVIGLLCAALGRPRYISVADLATLLMGVRVDREGVMACDFHTAKKVLKASGGIKDTEVSHRYYLADASFLVGLQGEETLLRQLHAALRNPVWPLYLGRKAFVPGEPIWLADGLRPGEDLLTALRNYPWHGRPGEKRPERLRLVLDDRDGPEVRPDLPLSFQSDNRRFAPRRVRTEWLSLKELLCTYPA
jgi:CRISPR system Cascade subunit CasD